LTNSAYGHWRIWARFLCVCSVLLLETGLRLLYTSERKTSSIRPGSCRNLNKETIRVSKTILSQSFLLSYVSQAAQRHIQRAYSGKFHDNNNSIRLGIFISVFHDSICLRKYCFFCVARCLFVPIHLPIDLNKSFDYKTLKASI